MPAYNVVLQVFLILNGNTKLVVFVHDVNGKNRIESVFMNRLPMLGNILACTTIGCTAFNNRTIYFFYQITDERRFQVMVVTAFAC